VPSKKERGPKRGRGEEHLSPDQSLLKALKALRRRLADQQMVPPYVVFSDATLVEMASRKPSDRHELLSINGVGEKKLDRYGQMFLACIQGSGKR
jgi:ATP-dependent DNA helicase RecQ